MFEYLRSFLNTYEMSINVLKKKKRIFLLYSIKGSLERTSTSFIKLHAFLG